MKQTGYLVHMDFYKNKGAFKYLFYRNSLWKSVVYCIGSETELCKL